MKKITRKQIGQPGEFRGYDGKVYYGTLRDVRRGIAVFTYYVPGTSWGDAVTYVPVKENRIEMY